MKIMTKPEYERWTASTRDERMKWWREAKFGMFVHYGLYAMIGRNEWAQVDENIPPERITLLATGEELEFEALEHRLIIKNLPKDCPDKHAGVAVFKLEFKDKPQYIYASRYPQLHGGERIL